MSATASATFTPLVASTTQRSTKPKANKVRYSYIRGLNSFGGLKAQNTSVSSLGLPVSTEQSFEEARKARASDFDFNPKQVEQGRGRGMSITTTTSSISHKKSRSLSPFRVADIIADDAHHQEQSTPSSFWGTFSLPKAYRKWRIKDLLFRSASEGRATEKLAVTEDVESRRFMENSSFRSVDTTASEFSVQSTSTRSNRKRVPVSAHELHYKLNRAVSQEMRKKTYLPYKQGLLGCLGFVPGGGGSEVSRSSTGSMTRV